MKSTGILRSIDKLGRIVIPMELRKVLELNVADSMEIFTDGEGIVLRKYSPCCTFCGEAMEVVDYKSKKVCKKCLKEMHTMRI